MKRKILITAAILATLSVIVTAHTMSGAMQIAMIQQHLTATDNRSDLDREAATVAYCDSLEASQK